MQVTVNEQCVKSLPTGGTEQLSCNRAAEISPPALYRQVRPTACVLTVGVDTAAAVVNLHM